MTKALLITADFKLGVGMKWMLNYCGFSVTQAGTLEEGKGLVEQVDFKVILLDTKITPTPVNFIKGLRLRGLYTPVIYIADVALESVILAESSGLDEVLTKPYNFAAMKKNLTRALQKVHSVHKPLIYSDIVLDESNRTLVVKGRRVLLCRLEMKILLLLCMKAGKVVALDRIGALIESEGVRFGTRVFYHVANLRRKLEAAGVQSFQINFVKDGYRVDLA
jgi:DNA-binding response OmpR family regulator